MTNSFSQVEVAVGPLSPLPYSWRPGGPPLSCPSSLLPGWGRFFSEGQDGRHISRVSEASWSGSTSTPSVRVTSRPLPCEDVGVAGGAAAGSTAVHKRRGRAGRALFQRRCSPPSWCRCTGSCGAQTGRLVGEADPQTPL